MRWKEKRRNKKSRSTCRSESDNASKQTGSYLLHCSTASTAQHNAVPQAQHSTQLSTQHSTIQSTRSTKPPSEYVPIRGRQRNQRAISSYSGVPGIIFVCVGLYLVCTRIVVERLPRTQHSAIIPAQSSETSMRRSERDAAAKQTKLARAESQHFVGRSSFVQLEGVLKANEEISICPAYKNLPPLKSSLRSWCHARRICLCFQSQLDALLFFISVLLPSYFLHAYRVRAVSWIMELLA